VPDETPEDTTTTMGSPHLTSYDDREEACVHAGMAGRVDIGSLHVCGECRWFKAGPGKAAEGHCGLYTKRMGGKVGDAIGAAQRACKMWLTNLGAAARHDQDAGLPAPATRRRRLGQG
jgi:hypothetical protein